MKVEFKGHTETHYWITAFWCALGAIVLGAIAVISYWIRKCRPNRKKRRNSRNVRRTNSENEFDQTALTAAARRQLFSSHRSASSEHDNYSDQSEHSEKSPLVSAKLDTLAKMFFSRSSQDSGKETMESSLSRPNLKYQYTALDSGNGTNDRSPKERAARDLALSACQEWIINSDGRYDIIAHLDEIGSRTNKNWFLINDTSVRTDRLMTLLPIPPDCVALEELPPCESPKGLLMELLGSLHHPYIYPVLDLGFLHTESSVNYVCLVMPFNPRGSLKDLIYKAQWNEPWSRKYSRKSSCLPLTQIQRLGRQILEALLFLKERGFPLHGHLHSGNVILQNGVARLSGLENGLLGLNSKVNAVIWSRSTSEVENIDIICFGYMLFEMCLGYELDSPKPTVGALEMELERCPQILEILLLIFDPPDGCVPTVEELVLYDMFRNIDLRELRGPCVSTIKPSLSKSTLNLLQAVKKRQSASLGGSYSEASTPCTPPSTPRDRRIGYRDSFDISSDSECALEEVVVTSSSYDSQSYDPLNSPIHFCDNSIQSDDNSSSLTTSVATALINEDIEPSNILTTAIGTTGNQLTTEMCTTTFKNSKCRRQEYSLKYLKYGRSNPSQDSAFGSLTDGELSIGSSSFRLSSFQSVSSPIDEGVEDMIVATTVANETMVELITNGGGPPAVQIDSDFGSSPGRGGGESSPNYATDDSITTTTNSKSPFSLSLSPKRSINLEISCASALQQFDPPKILVNDQNSIYTTSPSKTPRTIEVFSQKYRVSSFEDMSYAETSCNVGRPLSRASNTSTTGDTDRRALKNVNKLAFRSLEEEKRIDTAFMPIKDRTNLENRVYVNTKKQEKFKKLTHTSFSGSNRQSNSRDRYAMWKESIFYRKTKIAKSNDSLLLQDSPSSSTSGGFNKLPHSTSNNSPSVGGNSPLPRDNHPYHIHQYDLSKSSLNRGSSFNEIANKNNDDFTIFHPFSAEYQRKSRSERHLFSLAKLKQTAITDCCSEDDYHHPQQKQTNSLRLSGKKSLSLSSNSILQQQKGFTNQELNMRKQPTASVPTTHGSMVFRHFDELSEFFDDNDDDDDNESSDGRSSTSPLYQDICKLIGGVASDDETPSSSEEKTPLLDSMEMSPISPTEERKVLTTAS